MNLIELFKAALFGVIEGITEWLPISSTGHMILFNKFMPLQVSKEFYSMFEVVIQLGAILAVVVIFWNSIFPFQKDSYRSDFLSAYGYCHAVAEDSGCLCTSGGHWAVV